MIVKTLMENRAVSEGYAYEHGLSFLIQTEHHTVLFDMGQSDGFAKNAEIMHADLARVEYAVVSHGHYDHGGGLETFMKLNRKAPIYIRHSAFDPYYNVSAQEKRYIGLDKHLKDHGRVVYTPDCYTIDNGLELFANVRGREHMPQGNTALKAERDGRLVADDFRHEQYLIVTEGDTTVLFSGCAHRGIVNIVKHFIAKKGCVPDVVISGFHMYDRRSGTMENESLIRGVGSYLSQTDTQYYTCHCTGIEPYTILKEEMHSKVKYLASGSEVTL